MFVTRLLRHHGVVRNHLWTKQNAQVFQEAGGNDIGLARVLIVVSRLRTKHRLSLEFPGLRGLVTHNDIDGMSYSF